MTTSLTDALEDMVVTALNAMPSPPMSIEALALAVPQLSPAACETLLAQVDRLRHRPSIAEAIIGIYPGVSEQAQAGALRRMLDYSRPSAEPTTWHGPTLALAWPLLDEQVRAEILLKALASVPRPSMLMPLIRAGLQDLTVELRHLAYLNAPSLPVKDGVLLLSLIAPELDGTLRITAVENISRDLDQICLWSADECITAVPALCAVGLADAVQQIADSTTGAAKVWLYLALLKQALPLHQTILASTSHLINHTRSIGSERIAALVELLAFVDDVEQYALLKLGVDLCRSERNDQRRAADLVRLLPLLPAELLTEVQEITETINIRYRRVCVLAALAAQLDRHRQQSASVVLTAWKMISQMRNTDHKGLSLAAMLQHKAHLLRLGTIQRSFAQRRLPNMREAA